MRGFIKSRRIFKPLSLNWEKELERERLKSIALFSFLSFLKEKREHCLSEGLFLNQIFGEIKVKELESAVANNYWSSTENSSTNAWRVNFNNGNVNNNTKSENTRRVRCFLGQLILTRPAISYVRGATFKNTFYYEKIRALATLPKIIPAY